MLQYPLMTPNRTSFRGSDEVTVRGDVISGSDLIHPSEDPISRSSGDLIEDLMRRYRAMVNQFLKTESLRPLTPPDLTSDPQSPLTSVSSDLSPPSPQSPPSPVSSDLRLLRHQSPRLLSRLISSVVSDLRSPLTTSSSDLGYPSHQSPSVSVTSVFVASDLHLTDIRSVTSTSETEDVIVNPSEASFETTGRSVAFRSKDRRM